MAELWLGGVAGGVHSVPVWWMLWSGAAGGVIVFVLTTLTGVVVRTTQRWREVRGLSRVLRPEMKRNLNAIGIPGGGGYDRNTYLDEHPTREAWRDTRVRLSQLMQARDFAILASFYDDLELLDTAVARDYPMPELRLDKAQYSLQRAMQVVEGYCNAEWHPFKGLSPGPPDTPTEPSAEAQEGVQRP